jgi:hypothetical protein
MPQPTFSLVHTTARLPNGWHAAYKAWLKNCAHPENVEYVVAIDAKDETKWTAGYPERERINIPCGMGFGYQRLTINRLRTCATDGWDAAARASTGKFIITVADDLFPPPNWDEEILKVVPDLDAEVVLDVNYGNHASCTPHFFYFCLLTRARYEKVGYLFHPDYFGMYGDNEFTAHSYLDKVVVEARHLLFEHRHYTYGLSLEDDTYRWQQRPEAYATGKAAFDRRSAAGFPPIPKNAELTPCPERPDISPIASEAERGAAIASKPEEKPEQKKQKLAVCMPGTIYSWRWVASWDALRCFLAGYFDVEPIWASSSNVYAVRNRMAKQALEAKPDFILWLDADNILRPDQFFGLQTAVLGHPDAVIAAWCWCQPEGFRMDQRIVSAGFFDERGCCVPIEPEVLLAEGDWDLRLVDWTGFPCVLMTRETLEKAGSNPFRAELGEQFEYGMSGEDTAFCRRVVAAGGKILIDRHVRVEHLKLGEAGPRDNETVAPKTLTLLQQASEKVRELIGA